MHEPNVRLIPASQFSIDELTQAYNQTRVDYLVPMPMNAGRLSAYLRQYDVSLNHSVVAKAGEEVLGLGMLGVRPSATWITRLGVLPTNRRRGAGHAIMSCLLDNSARIGIHKTMLEVIKGNGPAHQLFLKFGFAETRELLILRRPPGKPPATSAWRVVWLDGEDALDTLHSLDCRKTNAPELAWTNQVESLANTADTQGITIELNNGGRGWLVFRREKFLISHMIFHTDKGDPRDITNALISHLYQRFPLVDTYTENIAARDPHLPAMLALGFIEVFRRIEMVRISG